MFPLKAAQPKLVWGGFGCDGITLGRFSFSMCTNMEGIADGCTLDRLIPHLSPPLWGGRGLRVSLDAGALPRMPPAFSAIRRRSEGGPADEGLEGGLKRIFGVDGGAEGSLCVWKQSGCNTISVCESI